MHYGTLRYGALRIKIGNVYRTFSLYLFPKTTTKNWIWTNWTKFCGTLRNNREKNCWVLLKSYFTFFHLEQMGNKVNKRQININFSSLANCRSTIYRKIAIHVSQFNQNAPTNLVAFFMFRYARSLAYADRWHTSLICWCCCKIQHHNEERALPAKNCRGVLCRAMHPLTASVCGSFAKFKTPRVPAIAYIECMKKRKFCASHVHCILNLLCFHRNF